MCFCLFVHVSFARPSKVPYGLARLVRSCGLNTIMSSMFQRVLYRILNIYKGSIADLEARHARNQRRCASAKGLSWRHFASNYVNAEIQAQMRTAELQKQKPTCRSEPLTPSAPRALNGVKRKQTAFELFRSEYFKKARALGQVKRLCDKEVVTEVREAFNNLPDEDVAHFESLSKASEANARANRQHRLAPAHAIADAPLGITEPEPDKSSGEICLADLPRAADFEPMCAEWLQSKETIRPNLFCSRSPFINDQLAQTPLSSEKVQHAVLQGGPAMPDGDAPRGSGITALLAAHAEQHKAPVAEDALDGRVRYLDAEHCRSLCRSSCPQSLFRMQRELLACLQSMTNRRTPVEVAKMEILIACRPWFP